MHKLARGTTDTLKYQKMLINVFVDKIYLYDDHFTIYLNNSKKGSNVSKNEVETIEKYFSAPSSESTSGCVPTCKPRDCEISRFFIFRENVYISIPCLILY